MASYYASALAGGGGTGTIVSPFTFAEMIAYINASFVAGDIAYMKADGTYTSPAYTITKAGTASAYCRMEGYTTTPGDKGVATVQRTAGTLVFATHTQNYWIFDSMLWDANSLGTLAVSGSANSQYVNCGFTRGGGGGIANAGSLINCKAYNNTTYGFSQGSCSHCHSYNNTTLGYNVPTSVVNSIASNNGTFGISINAGGLVHGCVVHANGGGGINCAQSPTTITDTAITSSASGYGINYVATGVSLAYNCNFYNNVGSGDTNIASNLINKKTVNPQYNNPAVFDFRRTGNNMDSIGLDMVGMLSFSFKKQIGIVSNDISYATIPTFAGITGLVTAAEGCLVASWAAGIDLDYYAVYVQAGTSVGLFSSGNIVFSVASSLTSAKIKALANGNLLDYSTTYYVGVRAVSVSGGDDGNVVSLSLIPSDNINVTVGTINTNVNALPATIYENRDGNIQKTLILATTIDPVRNVAVGKVDREVIKVKADAALDWAAPVSTKTMWFWYNALGDDAPIKVGEDG